MSCSITSLCSYFFSSCLRGSGAEEPIINACRAGTLLDVQRILRENSDAVSIRGQDEKTPLHFASSRVVSADVNKDDIKNIVQALLGAGASVNERDLFKKTPFFCACVAGNTGSARALANKDPTIVNMENYKGETALQAVIKEGKFSTAIFLINEINADVTVKNDRRENILNSLVGFFETNGEYPLDNYAEVLEKFPKLFELILKKVAESASASGKNLMKEFCENKGRYRKSPIECLIACGFWEYAKTLMRYGADFPEYKERHWSYFLSQYRKNSDRSECFISLFKFLNSLDIPEKTRKQNEESLLRYAIKNKYMDLVEEIVQLPLNRQSIFRLTCLSQLGPMSRNGVGRLTGSLHKSISPKHINVEVEGINPLLLCFLEDDFERAGRLFRIGGKLPEGGWQYLYKDGKTEDQLIKIAKLLLLGDETNLFETDGESLVHLAARKGLTKVMDFLLSQKIQFDLEDAKSQTPLQIACMGIDTADETLNDDERTLLRSRHIATARLLIEYLYPNHNDPIRKVLDRAFGQLTQGKSLDEILSDKISVQRRVFILLRAPDSSQVEHSTL
ncbi:MAG: hypothetical protein KR126chlam1_00211 [Chlamydiae bacterium]|nr:hypothetical protein [Chlamydiota bacterium]